MPEQQAADVLVVEDQEAIRLMMRAILEGAGFVVREAVTGEAAVEVFRQHAGSIGLAVLDRHLPGMDGIATARVLRQQDPELPLCFMTGNALANQSAEIAELGPIAVLPKPFKIGDLVLVVRNALRHGPQAF